MLTNQNSSLSVELQFGARYKLTTCWPTQLPVNQGFTAVAQYCTAAKTWTGTDAVMLLLCRGKARQQAQAEHKADVLAEENASLILELDARPTAKQYKSLQRQMDILERRLNDSKAQG